MRAQRAVGLKSLQVLSGPYMGLAAVRMERLGLGWPSNSVIVICIYCIYTYMAASQKHRACNRPGGLFATRLVTESGVLRQTLHATSLLKSTVLYTEARDRDKGV